ncbi:metal ABC transporter substrate-binding protein [Conexibacter sp. JD483]|uniref:metal ABC transporter substrate-binding protein n=1 Tax=unclassified Conexibacter TaxID=2627773 RepID=UPI00271FD4DD|nr:MULTISPECIES: metal ABC transporter substrate-binding protein [unclassified Conexibacter]MDO8189167.1 metal ABC transporter substrate-binding protein [Conexibacter sp. CPCC 205706]MDO8201947.1 metal ABC transporter substrate-binding protein [Conexibacter sp. CPCC 205762]MDR9372389.1 metal ABC transporter substrate-binding protein [Conexibacter sp. JD483]
MPTSRLRRALPLALLPAVAALAVGCGSNDDGGGTATSAGGSGGAGSVNVVATTTVIGDLAREIGGDAVHVDQLLQPNSDPHDYEPRPQDVVAVSKASLVFESGDGLDHWIEDVKDQAAGNPTLVDLASALPVQRSGEDEEHDHAEGGDEAGHDHGDGGTDPHWWHDPTNVETAADEVRDALIRANPDGRAVYTRNAAAYVAKVRALDVGIRQCLGQVPAAQRKLVTDHDALGYFADHYGVTVVGAVIPSLTTQAQPSAGDVDALARVIRREGVRAVFPESGANRKLPQALAQETGVSAEYQLYGDALGPEGSGAETYLGMEAHNADAMVRGFTDGAKSCTIDGI